MRKYSKSISWLIVSIMLLGSLAACVAPTAAPTPAPAQPTQAPAAEPTKAPEAPAAEPTKAPETPKEQPFGENLPTKPTINTPLVVAYSDFSQKFSPFFADTAYDQDVSGMTQISILTTDRSGKIIKNAIEGETSMYNGKEYLYKGAADINVDYDEASDTTKYTATLRRGMKFSDGEAVTIDDVIFTYYTYLDPSYVGSTTLSSYPILGLKDYQTQTTSAVYDKYMKLAQDILAAGEKHEWKEGDGWTKEEQEGYWKTVNANWAADVASIRGTVMAKYLSMAKDILGMEEDAVKADEGLQNAFAMAAWGFGEVKDGKLTDSAGKEYDLKATKPTMEDFVAAVSAKYEGDAAAYVKAGESPNGVDIVGQANDAFIKEWGPKDTEMGGKGVPNIAGIKKIDDYTVEVTTKGFSAPAVYSILGVNITPLHYYGDKAQYDYENNKFGFPFGDLSKQQSLTTTPMGAGPYKFVKYDNRVVYFAANENYYRGCPKIAEVQFKETVSAEVASGVQTGTVDAGEMTGSRARFDEVAKYNGNGEITGPVITTSKVDNLGYGYIGINADTVNVKGEPASDASKNLRKALGTIFAVYRDVAINSYYGEAASVINYPISNTSWAAPQPTDADYKVAFSVDAEGKPIYTADMTQEQKYEAASKAALGFFEKAGYTVANGKLTAAPEGAALTYEIIIPGGGTGDHPAFAILTGAKEAFEKIGFTLKINDPADSNVLWDSLDAGTQQMWTAAWGATIDPDMYQVYYSTNIVGKGGSDSNHYHIASDTLDKLIMDARKSDDQNYRKQVYKAALDEIIDWAVEIPTYQRQNCVVFSTERVNISTITPDITTFWGWMNDVELLEMAKK
ncbi:MAG: ABC transporter substrate-binding protein [Anaerolineaceae bacterium]|nr:ABC transporter substrate-binding protein [Anaerolineaceae bacterium]